MPHNQITMRKIKSSLAFAPQERLANQTERLLLCRSILRLETTRGRIGLEGRRYGTSAFDSLGGWVTAGSGRDWVFVLARTPVFVLCRAPVLARFLGLTGFDLDWVAGCDLTWAGIALGGGGVGRSSRTGVIPTVC